MEPESIPTSIVVDEDGDLLLLVGAATRILVSSKALTLASKVFKTMLSRSAFKESRELAESAARNEAYELPLPEDDAEAMAVFCKVIHHRYGDIQPASVTMDLLSNLATIAYKYDGVDAVRSVSGWLLKFGTDASGDRLLKIAYILDHAQVFQIESRRAMFAFKGDFKTLRESIDSDHQLPERVFYQLETTRQLAIQNAMALMWTRIQSMSEHPLGLEHEHGRGNVFVFSRHDAERVKVLMRELKNKGHWPGGHTAQSLIASFAGLSALSKASPNLGGRKLATETGCQSCQTTIPEIAKEILAEALAFVKGLCLDCIKRDGDEGICRVAH